MTKNKLTYSIIRVKLFTTPPFKTSLPKNFAVFYPMPIYTVFAANLQNPLFQPFFKVFSSYIN